MARKDNVAPSATAPRRFHICSTVGRFAAGDTATTDELFPGVADQAEIDSHTRRLLSLCAIAPHVEFVTPEPEPVAAEVIRPIQTVKSDHPEIAAGAVVPTVAVDTFPVPSFRPVATDAQS